MTPEYSHALAKIVEAHEAAELAVIVTSDRAAAAGDTGRDPAAAAEHLDACSIFDAIRPVYAMAHDAIARDFARSNHPTARALRGV